MSTLLFVQLLVFGHLWSPPQRLNLLGWRKAAPHVSQVGDPKEPVASVGIGSAVHAVRLKSCDMPWAPQSTWHAMGATWLCRCPASQTCSANSGANTPPFSGWCNSTLAECENYSQILATCGNLLKSLRVATLSQPLRHILSRFWWWHLALDLSLGDIDLGQNESPPSEQKNQKIVSTAHLQSIEF